MNTRMRKNLTFLLRHSEQQVPSMQRPITEPRIKFILYRNYLSSWTSLRLIVLVLSLNVHGCSRGVTTIKHQGYLRGVPIGPNSITILLNCQENLINAWCQWNGVPSGGGAEGRTLRHDAPLKDLAHLHYLKLANYNRVSGSQVSLLSEMNCS